MSYKRSCPVTLLSAFLTVFACPLLAFGSLSAEEVRSLFSGNTATGEFREGSRKHIDPSGVNTFYEPFVMYFSADGTVRSIRGEKKKAGKWRVDEKGNHCVQWKGKKEGCAPIIKEGRVYRKYMMKKGGGREKWVKTFTRFSPGHPDNL